MLLGILVLIGFIVTWGLIYGLTMAIKELDDKLNGRLTAINMRIEKITTLIEGDYGHDEHHDEFVIQRKKGYDL